MINMAMFTFEATSSHVMIGCGVVAGRHVHARIYYKQGFHQSRQPQTCQWKCADGRAHVWTPVTPENLVCRLLLRTLINIKKNIGGKGEYDKSYSASRYSSEQQRMIWGYEYRSNGFTVLNGNSRDINKTGFKTRIIHRRNMIFGICIGITCDQQGSLPGTHRGEYYTFTLLRGVLRHRQSRPEPHRLQKSRAFSPAKTPDTLTY